MSGLNIMLKNTSINVILFIVLQFVSAALVQAAISKELLDKANNGDSNAQYTIARAYELGKRMKTDKKKAIEWYTKAADQGHLEAGYRLGLIYYKGIGGYKIDLKKAFHYISMAAKGNHKRSQAHMAKMYENGDGIGKDKTFSDYWYEQAFNDEIQPLQEYLREQKDKLSSKPAKTAVAAKPIRKKPKSKSKPRPVAEVDLFKSLAKRKWLQNNQPSKYLKSSRTTCKYKKKKISCTSSILKGLHSSGLYKYKLKSIITRGNTADDIQIVYRKRYLMVPEEEIGGYDDEDAGNKKQNLLTLGWEKNSHTITCKFETDYSVLCRPPGEDAFYIKAK